MTLKTFKYTDAKGKETERTVYITVKPQTLFGGIDVSELDPADSVEFAVEYRALYQDFIEKSWELQKQYDVRHNYRLFKPEQMVELENISI